MKDPDVLVKFLKTRQIPLLITACALGMLALIIFQVSWMNHSRRLLNEQFNNRVNMALCSSVEKMAENQACSSQIRSACCTQESSQPSCSQTLDKFLATPEMDRTLENALRFYQIDLPYKAVIKPLETSTNEAPAPPYSCSLNPILQNDTHMLQLEFQGKTGYLLRQMDWMAGASIAILLFVCGVFSLASYYLVRQKKMSDLNRDFFNHMTHEFRTPLTNIRLAGGLLSRKNKELKDNQYLEIIQNESNRLMTQVESVLHLATLEKGDYQLKKTPVDLKYLVGDVIHNMQLQIREKNARIRLTGQSPAYPILGDPFHLANVFRNLLDNALKYNPSNTEINIGLEQSGDGCKVCFEDNGVGLSEEERERIFHKYYRCTDDQKGFGLGLAYAKKIVEMHFGQIRLKSEKGNGAHFELFFPN